MTWGSGELVGALAFLLPGFVSAAIYHALTSHPKPSAFERVILALIFTAIVQAIATLLPSSVRVREVTFGAGVMWDPLWSTGLAVLAALIVVLAVNNDIVHWILRRLTRLLRKLPWMRQFSITRQNSYASVWDSSFARYDGCYVVLHLTGQRRLYGWPDEWPSDPERGHFRVTQGEWLTYGGSRPLDGVVGILVPGSEVEMVEFLRSDQDKE